MVEPTPLPVIRVERRTALDEANEEVKRLRDLLGQEKPDRRAFGAHESARMKNDEWLTPPEILSAIGPFDLDPCAPRVRPWETAAKHYTVDDNGLLKPWHGRVWLNPPYSSQEVPRWLARLAEHGNGMALVFARTETEWYFDNIWNRATACLFLRGRLCFHYVDGRKAKANAGAPSVLVAYGADNAEVLRRCGIVGQFVPLSSRSGPTGDH